MPRSVLAASGPGLASWEGTWPVPGDAGLMIRWMRGPLRSASALRSHSSELFPHWNELEIKTKERQVHFSFIIHPPSEEPPGAVFRSLSLAANGWHGNASREGGSGQASQRRGVQCSVDRTGSARNGGLWSGWGG